MGGAARSEQAGLRAAFAGVPTGGALCRECAFSDAFGKWVPAAKEA